MKRVPCLDLHGYAVADVADAVDRFLVQSQNKGLKQIRIMTGKGTGAVKKAVESYLRQGGFPFSEERQPSTGKAQAKTNSGVLLVHLDD